MNELYLIKSGDNGFVEETSAVISADSGEISINDSLYVESAGNIGIGSSNPVNKLDVVGSASISSDLTVNGITFSNVGGNSPSAVNDIIKYDGNNWVVAASTTLPGGGGGGAGSSDVPAGLINTLTQGETIHEVDFGYDSNNDRIVYDNVPKIAASLEIDGAGEIIPHTVSGVSESGYFVVFSEELPTANYRMHTVFGGTDAFWETGVANLEYSERSVEIDRSLYVGQKVGIGTTNPVTKLQVVETSGGTQFEVRGTAATGGQFQINNAGGDIYANFRGAGSNDDVAKINTNGNSFFNGGNVGIGTTNPAQKLDIYGKFTVNHDGVISWGPSGMGRQFWDSGKVIIRGESGNALHLGANGLNDHLIVNTSGNVGIGTTNPIADLDINGTLIFSTAPTSSQWMFETGSNTLNIKEKLASGSFSSRVTFLDGGNVGIGTASPTNALNVVRSSTSGVPVAWLHNSNNTTSGNQGVTVSCINNNSGVKVFTIRSNNSTHTNGTALMEVNGQGGVYLSSLAASSDVVTNSSKQLTTSSDKRLKNDLGDCEYGLSEIMQVQPKKYTWKEGPEDQQPTIGFFAQDVHPIMPEAAPREAFKNEKDEDDYKWGLNSQTIIAALVNATKEQQQIIEDLKSRIENLEK